MKKKRQFYIAAYGPLEKGIADAATNFGWQSASDASGFFAKKGEPVVHFANESDEAKKAVGHRAKDHLFNCTDQYCRLKRPFVILGNVSQLEQNKIKTIIAKSSISGIIIPDIFMENFAWMRAWFLERIPPDHHDQVVFFARLDGKISVGHGEYMDSYKRTISMNEWETELPKIKNAYIEALQKHCSQLYKVVHIGGLKFIFSARGFGITQLEITDPYVDIIGIKSTYKSLDFLHGLKGKEKSGNLWIFRQDQFIKIGQQAILAYQNNEVRE